MATRDRRKMREMKIEKERVGCGTKERDNRLQGRESSLTLLFLFVMDEELWCVCLCFGKGGNKPANPGPPPKK